MLKPKVQDSALNARILYYDFFSGLFIYDLLQKREDILIAQLDILLNSPICDEAHYLRLKNELCNNGISNLAKEYTYKFMLPFNPQHKPKLRKKKKNMDESSLDSNLDSSSQIPLYLSFYLDKSIAGIGLVRAKEIIKKSKFRLDEKHFRENEEHFGFLMLVCKNLLQNGENNLWREVSNHLINPMKNAIIKNLKKDENGFYYDIAHILEVFLDYEDSR